MIESTLPPAPELWATVPTPNPAPLLKKLATLRLENAALQARVRELEAQLSQDSSNSSRPPSSDPRSVPPKRRPKPSGRKRGGQPGHRGAFRRLLPVEQVDEVVVVAPEVCWYCQRPLPEPTGRRRGRVWRHQVVELLPLAVRVTEYQMGARRCPVCGKRTRADLPAGVSRRPFGARLTALIALLSGRYRLSRREVRQLLQEVWAVRVSLGAVVRQEQVQSAALAPVVEEARAAIPPASVVNMDETGWREDKQRAWLGTAVTAELTVFRVDRSRGGSVVDTVLGSDFAGIVGSDRWCAYTVRSRTTGLMLGAPEAGRSGAGRPAWRSGTDRPLGTGGDRTPICAVAPLPRRAVRAGRVTTTADTAPGEDGAATSAWAGEPGSQSRRAVPRTGEVVARAVDVCPSGRRGADEQCVGARPAAGGAVAQGELWLRQRRGQPVRGAPAHGGSILPTARPAAVAVPGGRRGGGTPPDRRAIAAP